MNIHAFLREDEKTRKLDETLKKMYFGYGLSNRKEEKPDIVLSIGGDGTFLDAVRNYGLDPIYIGINTGSLGFYADWQCEDVENLLSLLKSGSYVLAKQNVLEFEIHFENKETLRSYAVNELSFRNQTFQSVETEVFINDLLFETFRGDGLVISTPSGSTAFNKSLGGSIIDPEFEAIHLKEIAGVNNRVHQTIQNGILLPKSKELIFRLKTNHLQIAFDNIQKRLENVEAIECRVGDSVKSITKEKEYHWKRVKKSFL